MFSDVYISNECQCFITVFIRDIDLALYRVPIKKWRNGLYPEENRPVTELEILGQRIMLEQKDIIRSSGD